MLFEHYSFILMTRCTLIHQIDGKHASQPLTQSQLVMVLGPKCLGPAWPGHAFQPIANCNETISLPRFRS